jgi:hypothetical protein
MELQVEKEEHEIRRVGPLRVDWTFNLADLAAIIAAVFSLVYTFGILSHTIKDHERRIDKIEARADVMEKRVEEKLDQVKEKLDKLLGREEAHRDLHNNTSIPRPR